MSKATHRIDKHHAIDKKKKKKTKEKRQPLGTTDDRSEKSYFLSMWFLQELNLGGCVFLPLVQCLFTTARQVFAIQLLRKKIQDY